MHSRSWLPLAALCLTASAPAPKAVPYRWSNVTVGAGGFAPGIVFSPAQRGLAILRTDMGGAYRWEDKAGRWVPLMDGFAEGSFYGIESIAPDPKDANRVLILSQLARSALRQRRAGAGAAGLVAEL
jgi:xyloglucan-specific exo-beta-1,4-glucanase